jgi:Uma2 family endonuclease
MKQATKLTADEFITEYSKLPDAKRYELLEGEIVMSPEPTPYHAQLQVLVLSLLDEYANQRDNAQVFGPTNLVFADDTCVGPDALVVLASDKANVRETKIVGAPSLVIEIVSPSQPHLDLLKKRDLYIRQKVSELWFFDSAEREALFLTRAGSKYREQSLKQGIYHSTVLKGLKFDVGALFALDRKVLRKSTGM